ncbi:hypothetical protein CPL00160_CDS0071 [Escherchia phage Tuinin]
MLSFVHPCYRFQAACFRAVFRCSENEKNKKIPL